MNSPPRSASWRSRMSTWPVWPCSSAADASVPLARSRLQRGSRSYRAGCCGRPACRSRTGRAVTPLAGPVPAAAAGEFVPLLSVASKDRGGATAGHLARTWAPCQRAALTRQPGRGKRAERGAFLGCPLVSLPESPFRRNRGPVPRFTPSGLPGSVQGHKSGQQACWASCGGRCGPGAVAGCGAGAASRFRHAKGPSRTVPCRPHLR
jgi:hypothetical protein